MHAQREDAGFVLENYKSQLLGVVAEHIDHFIGEKKWLMNSMQLNVQLVTLERTRLREQQLLVLPHKCTAMNQTFAQIRWKAWMLRIFSLITVDR